MAPEVTIQDVLERLAALQREIDGVKLAIPGFLDIPAQFPAFVNRVGAAQPGQGGAARLRQKWTFHMRLIVGSIEQGYEGQNEAKLYELMKTVPLYFAARPRLELDGAPSLGILGPAQVGACTGLQTFQDGPYFHIGTEFPITLTLEWGSVKRYK